MVHNIVFPTQQVPASNKSKQVVDSPTPKKAPESPVPSPVQEPVPSPVQEPVPSPVQEPVPSPVQEPVPTSPDLPAASEESNQDDASAMPADADEEVEHVEQDSPTPEETPVEDIEPEIAEVLDLSELLQECVAVLVFLGKEYQYCVRVHVI